MLRAATRRDLLCVSCLRLRFAMFVFAFCTVNCSMCSESHATRIKSHITLHTSFVSRHMHHIVHLTPDATWHPPHLACHISHASCRTSHGMRHTPQVKEAFDPCSAPNRQLYHHIRQRCKPQTSRHTSHTHHATHTHHVVNHTSRISRKKKSRHTPHGTRLLTYSLFPFSFAFSKSSTQNMVCRRQLAQAIPALKQHPICGSPYCLGFVWMLERTRETLRLWPRVELKRHEKAAQHADSAQHATHA